MKKALNNRGRLAKYKKFKYRTSAVNMLLLELLRCTLMGKILKRVLASIWFGVSLKMRCFRRVFPYLLLFRDIFKLRLLFASDYSVAPEAPVRNFEQQLSGKNSSALS